VAKNIEGCFFFKFNFHIYLVAKCGYIFLLIIAILAIPQNCPKNKKQKKKTLRESVLLGVGGAAA